MRSLRSVLRLEGEAIARSATHVVHEALAAEDVCEEPCGVFDVRAAFAAHHLLAVLVVDDAQVLCEQDQLCGNACPRFARTESDRTRYASLAKR